MNIPFLDLNAQYHSIKVEVDQAIAQTLENLQFIRGKNTAEFEENFARKNGAAYAVGVGNGTDALFISLKLLGIGSGDEVITAVNTCMPTAEAISRTGATPVFTDIDPESYTLDPANLSQKITPKTKAIVPVHLYGHPADMNALQSMTSLPIIEDCSHAHFAKIGERHVGLFGKAGAFSFYPSKNLGAYGDGGCIITDDKDFGEKMAKFGNHGSAQRDHHEFIGVNSRLDGIQAAILNVKLKHINTWTEKRIANAKKYEDLLGDLEPIVIPACKDGYTHTYHLYVIRCRETGIRDRLKAHLESRGVQTEIHYPYTIPELAAYRELNIDSAEFEIANDFKDKILSLPVYPEMTSEMISYVSEGIRSFFK